jgi:nitroreductase
MRTTDAALLDKRFIERWSPRSFLPDPVSDDELLAIFEAARWSPSCYNAQPWRFVYATDGESKERLLSALVESNRAWARQAPVIAYAFSYNRFDHNNKPNRWAEFDTGAAWMALTFQANQLGYHSHAMGGFDVDMAFEVCGVDAGQHTALCGIVIGKFDPDSLLDEETRKREEPSERELFSRMVTRL